MRQAPKPNDTDYPNVPYQASVIGTRNVPPAHYDWQFLEDLAKELKGGQALRMIVPLELGMPFIDKAWRRVCKKLDVRPHTRAIKNGTNKAVFLWFDGVKL